MVALRWWTAEPYLYTAEHAGGAFDPESIRILAAALDDAWHYLETTGVRLKSPCHAEATRQLLALQIIKLAKAGERDHRRLREGALHHLAKSSLAQRKRTTTAL